MAKRMTKRAKDAAIGGRLQKFVGAPNNAATRDAIVEELAGAAVAYYDPTRHGWPPQVWDGKKWVYVGCK